jgi:hypothetical protein
MLSDALKKGGINRECRHYSRTNTSDDEGGVVKIGYKVATEIED